MPDVESGEVAVALESWLRRVVREVVREELAAKKESGRSVVADEFVTVQKAAVLASVNAATIRAWIAQGHIPRFRAGRLTRVRIRDLMDFMASDHPKDPRRKTVDQVVAKIIEGERKRG